MVIQTVHEIDENAFIMMTNTSQVLGEGFIEKTDKKQIF